MKRRSTPIAIARYSAQIARQQTEATERRADDLSRNPIAGWGTYESFDVDTGIHRIKLANDRILAGQMIFNAGAKVGDRIHFTRVPGVKLATFKAMVR